MKKILIIFTVLLSLLSFTACGVNSTSNKALEEGKISIVNGDYEKAKNFFKLAINEDNKNSEAKTLFDLVDNYMNLLTAIETGEFENADNLISSIENNQSLEIIKDEFEKTKNSFIENKEKLSTYTPEVEAIEKLLSENKIDDTKEQAITKLEEVKGIKSLEDRLNAVIAKVDEIITNAKAEIVKHLGYQTDMEYTGMKLWDDTYFSAAKELSGRVMLSFDQIIENSPAKYMYDIESKNAYQYSEGTVYLLNNKVNGLYEELYGYEDYLKEQEEIAKSKIKISSEESRQIALSYYLSKRPDVSADEVFVGMGDDIEDNEYFRPIALDNGDGNPGKVVAEYYINATTGKVRVLWD